MITPMTKYSFVLLSEQKEDFLERLQGLGLVDIVRSEKPVDETSASILSGIEGTRKLIKEIEQGSDQHLLSLKAEVAAWTKKTEELARWGDYDREKLALTGVELHFYQLSSKQFSKIAATTEDYALVVADDDGKTVRFVIAGDNSAFPAKEIPAPELTAGEAQAVLDAKTKEAEDYAASLLNRRKELPGLREKLSSLEEDLARWLAGATAVEAVEGRVSLMTGYAPTENEAEVEGLLDGCALVYYREAATIEDNPPVKLRNRWFFRQFEVLTKMYGSPAYNEFDPTPILGPFFLLFFAMCMGDAGYGLLLILIGWLLKKKIPSMAELSPLVMMLGAATFAVGIVLHTFFGINLYEAAWVPGSLKKIMIAGTVAGYDAQMVLAIGVGVVHICLAMVVKALCFTRKNGFLNTLGTWGWTLLIVGGVILAGVALTGVIDKEVTKWAVIALGAVSATGIFLLNNPRRNPLVNIGAGLWDTYNTATGLLGDVLSYLRLFALGMAGGMLGNTFNMLGGMVLSMKIPGANYIAFALIILVGHALNLALSCLGAFVHPLRLTFVEYFKNSGYEGSGREYKPLK